MDSNTMITWLQRFGALVDKDLEWPVHFPNSGRGVACSRNLQKRQVLLRIPEALTLTPEKCFEGGIKSLLQSVIQDEYVMIALFLLQETSKVIISDFLALQCDANGYREAYFRSPWEDYIRTLPSASDIVGIYYSWEDDEKHLVNDPLMISKGNVRTDELRVEYEKVVATINKALHPQKEGEVEYTHDALFTAHLLRPLLMDSMGPYMWAVGCVTSRVFLHGLNIDSLFQSVGQFESSQIDILPSHFQSVQSVNDTVASLQRLSTADPIEKIPIAVLPLADMFNHQFDAPETYTRPCSNNHTLTNRQTGASMDTVEDREKNSGSSQPESGCLLHDIWQTQHIHKPPKNKNRMPNTCHTLLEESVYIENLRNLWTNTFCVPNKGDTFDHLDLLLRKRNEDRSNEHETTNIEEMIPKPFRDVLRMYCFIGPGYSKGSSTDADSSPSTEADGSSIRSLYGHSPTASLPRFISELSLNKYYELRTASAYTAGTELLISYGDRASRDTLENYGFCVPWNVNKSENLSLPISQYFHHSFPIAWGGPTAYSGLNNSESGTDLHDVTLIERVLNKQKCEPVDNAVRTSDPDHSDADSVLGLKLFRKFLFDRCHETFEEIEMQLPESVNTYPCLRHGAPTAIKPTVQDPSEELSVPYRQLVHETHVHSHVLQLFRILLLDRDSITSLSTSLDGIQASDSTTMLESLQALAKEESTTIHSIDQPISYSHELAVVLVILDLLLTELLSPYSNTSTTAGMGRTKETLRPNGARVASAIGLDASIDSDSEDRVFLQVNPLLPCMNRDAIERTITSFRNQCHRFLVSTKATTEPVSPTTNGSIRHDPKETTHNALHSLTHSVERSLQILAQLYHAEACISHILGAKYTHNNEDDTSPDELAVRMSSLLDGEMEHTSTKWEELDKDDLQWTHFPQLGYAQNIDTKTRAPSRATLANSYRKNRLFQGLTHFTNYYTYFLLSVDANAVANTSRPVHLPPHPVQTRCSDPEVDVSNESSITDCARMPPISSCTALCALSNTYVDDVASNWDGVCLEVQEHWTRMIIHREKSIEIRAYPLPAEYKGRKIGLLSTPPGGTRKNGLHSGKLVGFITFTKSKCYRSEMEWEADAPYHRVETSDPIFSFQTMRQKEEEFHTGALDTVYGWEIDPDSIQNIPTPFQMEVHLDEENRIYRSLFQL